MKQIKQLALGVCLCAAYLPMQGQVTQLNNTVTLANQYIGCDGFSNQALRFTTQLNFPQEWRTNNILRMRLNESLPGQPVNNFPSVDLSGHLGIGAPVPAQALSFLHINNNGSFFAGFRPWMRTGVSMSENTDWMYVGAKNQGEDLVDAVINWGDNKEADPTYGPDALRFIFTRIMTGLNPASQMDGLELARIIPDPMGDQGYFGIGDYFTSGTNPSERLDVLNGRVAIRELPTDPASASMEAVVVNTSTGVLEHRPFPTTTGGPDCAWRLAGGPGTDSNVLTAYNGGLACPQRNRKVGIGTAFPAGKLGVTSKVFSEGGPSVGLFVDLYGSAGTNVGSHVKVQRESGGTAGIQYGTLTEALDGVGNYGLISNAYISSVTTSENTAVSGRTEVTGGSVGTNRSGYFLANESGGTITTNIGSWASAHGGVTAKGAYAKGDAGASTATAYGVDARATNAATANYAVNALANTTAIGTGTNYGVYAAGSNGSTNYGVYAQAVSNSTSTNFGVKGFAYAANAADVCYGVYGSALGPDNTGAPNGHSKWAGYFPGYTYTPGAMWSSSDEQLKHNIETLPTDEAMNKLQQLTPKTYDFDQDQFGFMHLPTEHQYGLIAQEVEAVFPEFVTTIHQPAMLDSAGAEESPAIDFKAMNYQGFIPLLIAGFKAQQQQITALQDQIDHCCAAQGDAGTGRSLDQGSIPPENDLQEQRLLIIPNPVADLTTLAYYVPKAGRMSLQVSTSDGKPLAILREELAEAGAYNYSWNTTKLAAGTYFCTFMLDGTVVVKRAVKVK